MITPVEAQAKRAEIAKQVTDKLLAQVDIHATACEKDIDQHLIRCGVAHFSEQSISLSATAEQLITENLNLVSGIKDLFVRKVLGHLETKYRMAGWNTVVKKNGLKFKWEIIVKEKELDPMDKI